MGPNNLIHKIVQPFTLFILVSYISKSVTGLNLSFDESQCQNQTTRNTFSVQCSQNSTILFDMITNSNTEKIYINCHEENPFYSNFLPNSNIQNADYVQFNSCQFPANVQVQQILRTKLGILEIDELVFNNELMDNSISSFNLKGLDEISKLNFKFKDFSTLPKDIFVELKKLKTLEIFSKNPSELPSVFDSLENLKFLYINRNNFQYIPGKIFAHQRKLDFLKLKKNNLTYVTKESFEGLATVSNLDLSINSIQTVQSDVFSHLTKLLSIDLSGNKFISLPKDLFAANKELGFFYLNKNQVALKQLPGSLLRDLPKLYWVYISCQLESIPSDLFANSKSIFYINLSGNNLHEFPLGLFADQAELNALILADNKIETLSDGLLFYGTRNLKELDLSNNQLKHISNDIFNHVTQLESLDLNNNFLGTNFQNNQQQSSSPFDNLSNLEELLLRNNSLDEHFYRILNAIGKPIQMDLSFNNIKSISCDYVQYFAPVKFTGNPLHCDCKIMCLYNQFKNSKSQDRSMQTFRCETPNNLRGRYLTELESIELVCSDGFTHNA